MLRPLFRRLIRSHLKSQRQSLHRATPWTFGGLEERLLLAADTAAAVSHSPADTGNDLAYSPGLYSEAAIYGPASLSKTATDIAQSTDNNSGRSVQEIDVTLLNETTVSPRLSTDTKPIVFIDSRVETHEQMTTDLKGKAEIHVIDSSVSGVDYISQILAQRSDLTSIHLIGHGSSGYIEMGSDGLNSTTVKRSQDSLGQWSKAMRTGADILVYGCETGAGSEGSKLLNELAKSTGLDVAGSVDKTGSERLAANWQMEVQVGNVESAVLFSAAFQSDIAHVLPIYIRAAGQTGDEEMSLLIDGRTVETWSDIGGDYEAGEFETYVYNTNGISADRIRVAFTNDAYADGYDRNLRVDSITTDGITIHSTEAQVFATGVWNEATNSIDSGYFGTDKLASNGYFQFAHSSQAQSDIVIRAQGQTGDERLSLMIDNEVVSTWSNIGDQTEFSFQTNQFVTIDRIKVVFDNDLLDSATGYDRNITVDSVSLNGQTFNATDSGVLNVSYWNNELGAVGPGFHQSGELLTNGYLSFSADNHNTGDTILIHAAGSMGGERMNLKVGGETVRSWLVEAGADQQQYQWYGYRLAEGASLNDVQIEFVGDRYEPGVYDANLRIDQVKYNGVVSETESQSNLKLIYNTLQGPQANFDATEFLYSDGFVQYSTDGQSSGIIGLASSRYTIDEDSGLAVLHVVRNGGTDGSLLIDYTTVNGTALAGQDFVGKSGTLMFLPGQSTATITINLLNDAVYEGNETFNVTIDNLRGPGTLGAPRTATVLINDDDAVLPNYPTLANATDIKINGSASINATGLQLTPASANSIGSAFFNTALPINATTSFQTEFTFRLDGGPGTTGTNGFAFVIQNSPAGISAIGNSSGGLAGYGGLANSLSIEFDTVQNSGEVSNNHISIVVNGTTVPLVTKNVGFDLNNGGTHKAWIEYNGDAKTISVFVQNGSSKPTTALASATVDLQQILGSSGYMGFTASGTTAGNAHRILSWNTKLTPPALSPASIGTNLANEIVGTGFVNPTDLDFSPDGANIYVAQQNGIVHIIRNGVRQTTPFIDISSQVNGTRDRGLLDIAVHPDFENNPYVYLLFTYDPPEVYQNTNHTLAGPDRNGNRAGRLIRVTADAATNYTTAVAGSEVVLLGKNSTWNNFNAFVNSTSNFSEPAGGIRNGVNVQDFIASDSESHSVGSLAFGIDGALFVSIGDGTSYNQVDPRTVRVQDIDNLSGKVLRIDPLTGEGLSDNPFYNGDANANRSKVYQLGLRNPFRISVDSETGKLYVGDVGWTQWEEINSAGAGANFGWPYFEGGNGTSVRTNGYQNLAQAQAFYASGAQVVAPLVGRSHSATGINAIVSGSVYRGDTYPDRYDGDIFFNDLGQGIVSNVSFNADGTVANIETFATGAQYVTQILQGVDGNLYYTSLYSGQVGRWVFV